MIEFQTPPTNPAACQGTDGLPLSPIGREGAVSNRACNRTVPFGISRTKTPDVGGTGLLERTADQKERDVAFNSANNRQARVRFHRDVGQQKAGL